MTNLYAYDAGYADGQTCSAPKKAEGWHEATIRITGAAGFGVRCGLTDNAIVERGAAWQAACNEYDRGCTDGLNARASS